MPLIIFKIRVVRVTRRPTTFLDLELGIVAVVPSVSLPPRQALGSVTVPVTLDLL